MKEGRDRVVMQAVLVVLEYGSSMLLCAAAPVFVVWFGLTGTGYTLFESNGGIRLRRPKTVDALFLMLMLGGVVVLVFGDALARLGYAA